MLQHLIDLGLAQLIGECRHVGLAVVDDLAQLSVAPFLHIFRAKIGGLQLFAERSLSATIATMTENTLGTEDVGARSLCCLLRHER